MRAYSRLPVVFLLAVLAGVPLGAQTITTAGDFSVEPPTLLSLGFDWKITGDDNRNAQVDLTYRKKGETAWKKGLPLLRLQREWVNGGPPLPTDDPLTAALPVRLRGAEHVLGERAQSRAGHRIRMPPRAVGSGRRAWGGDKDGVAADAP